MGTLIDKLHAIWIILTRRNFIVAGYNGYDVNHNSIGTGFVEHFSEKDMKHVNIFRNAMCEYINPNNSYF